MPDTDMCQDRDLTSIGIKTWMSISSLQNCGKPNVEVKASIMDIQQVIPLHIKQWM